MKKSFNWNDYPEETSFSWDNYKEEPSQVESVARGAAQGLSAGFSDETSGMISAATGGQSGISDILSPAGPAKVAGQAVIQAGKQLFDVATTDKTLKDVAKQYVEDYKKGRNLERQANAEALEANPWSYRTANVIGGFIPASKAVKAGGAILGLAGAGAIQSLGETEREGSEAAIDAAIGAGVGATIGSAGVGTKMAAAALSKLKPVEAAAKVLQDSFKTPTTALLATKAEQAVTSAGKILDKAQKASNTVKVLASPLSQQFLTDLSGRKKTAREWAAELGNGLVKQDAEDVLGAMSTKPVDGMIEAQNELANIAQDILLKGDVKRAENFLESMGALVHPDLAEGLLSDPDAFRQVPDEAILKDLDVAAESMVAEQGLKGLLKNKPVVLANPIKAAQDDMIKVHKALENTANKINSLDAVSKGSIKEQYQNMLKSITELSNNANTLANNTDAQEVAATIAPNLMTKYNLQLIQAVKYLEEVVPKKATVGLLKKEYVPSDQELKKFKDQFEAIMSPAEVIGNMESGKVTLAQVEAIAKVYPNMLAIAQQRIINKIAKSDKKYSYTERLRLSKILGVPVDSSFSPNSIRSLQSTYQPQQDQGQAPQGPARPAQLQAPQVAGGAESLLKAR